MNMRNSNRTRGFTVIELMIAVAIIAILAAIAIPVYTMYSNRTYRAEAMADLLDCAQTLERRASATFSYAGAGVGAASGGANPDVAIDPAICGASSVDAGRYAILYRGDDTSFALLADSLNNTDEGRDLSYNSAGQRGWDENGDGAIADPGEMTWEEN